MKDNWVYRRGDLYLANLGVPVGSKQGGVRPVVVLQNDVGNYYAPTITIAPLTSKIEKKRKQPRLSERKCDSEKASSGCSPEKNIAL